MKRVLNISLIFILLLTFFIPITAYADSVGDGNLDGGGGGMGNGSSTDYWNGGDEGVRVTVIRVSDHAVVTTPIDLTNKHPVIAVNFRKVCKISYTGGRALSPDTNSYDYVNPSQPLPKIISTSGGNGNIAAIKSYFTDEQVIRSIASLTGMNFDVLINGQYRLFLEPIAYMTFGGIKYAMTATEAALFDRQLDGGLRSKMVSLSHKNLPLAMFLETSDLGYPAWGGSTTTAASDADIISSLGLGIVRFNEAEPEPPEVATVDYEYRVNTEVITSVTVRGGQADPDHPVTVRFTIGGQTYAVSGVYYPEGDSQLVWVRWTTPATPRTMTIGVNVSGGGSASQGTITAKIMDLSGNDPPNPVADDRNDSYTRPGVPSKAQKTSASWGVWRPWWFENWVWHSDWNWYSDGEGGGHWEDDGEWVDEGWWEFDWDAYHASLSASMSIIPDAKNPTASGKTMKSGYGVNQTTTANVSTNQSSAVTDAQNAVTYFPEFQYKTYWRLLERTQSGYSSKFEFAANKYSTYERRTHFSPIWFPDGSYTPYTWLIDCWDAQYEPYRFSKYKRKFMGRLAHRAGKALNNRERNRTARQGFAVFFFLKKSTSKGGNPMKLKRILPVLLVVLLLGCMLCTTAYAASTGDVAGAIENTWNDASDQIKTVVNKVVFPAIDLILAVFFFAKLGTAYFDYRKHGQFEFAAPAILFACLVFTLTAPLYIWQILGM